MRFSVVGKTYKIDRIDIEKVAKAAFSYLGALEKNGEIELTFVSGAKIQELNRIYRHVDKPTDVLSFKLSDEPLVGQIFICYTYTGRQANSQGKSLLSEVALLAIHGILHIFGYDHACLKEEKEMQEIERNILLKEGFSR